MPALLVSVKDHPKIAQIEEAFRTADEVVTQGILSVSELINVPGEINVDFADVKTIMTYPGDALMAIGNGSGREGPLEAARQAIAIPLLNLSIDDGRGVLFSVKGGRQLTLGGVTAAGELIAKAVKKDAQILFGMCIDHGLEDNVRLTLIATGLPQNRSTEVTEKYSLQGGHGAYDPLGQNNHQDPPETPPEPPKRKRGWWG